MYRTLIYALAAVASALAFPFEALAQEEAGMVYVVPVGSDGSPERNADGTFYGQMPLLPRGDEKGITAMGVTIEYGFVFLAVSADGSKSTYYTALSDDIVMGGEHNELVIAPNTSRFIKVAPGGYDITFYRRGGTSGYNSFAISPTILTGIDLAEGEPEAAAEYFDLSGRPVSGGEPAPGVYVVRVGSAVSKVLVR